MNSDINRLFLEHIDSPINIANEIERLNVRECEKNSLIRLLKSYNLFRNNAKYKLDFEISLRDFLILEQSGLIFPNYELDDNASKLGLNRSNDIVYVTFDYPIYINNTFAMRVGQITNIVKNHNENECLILNKFISERVCRKFNSFKSEEQKLCVMGALKTPKGYTTLISMSTGGGKSLVTQMVALQEEGLSIAIVPTISLMIDQANNARNVLGLSGNEIYYYNSSNSYVELEEKLINKEIKLLFLSPEALIKNKKLKQLILDINKSNYLKNLIIDEAHIIFGWGDAFRLDFQGLDVLKKIMTNENSNLRTFLLSATFTKNEADMIKKLYSQDDKWIEIRCDSLRNEINYNFIKAENYKDKMDKALSLVMILPHPMIVYVQRPDQAESLRLRLSDVGLNNCFTFTGKTSENEREKLIDSWKKNNFQIMIATSAFGVGVDKKDIRTILHLYVPDSLNNYYQEAGRGGRDGNQSLSIILYDDEDIDNLFTYSKKGLLTTEKINRRWFDMLNKATKYSNGQFLFDTSIKPNYNNIDEEDEILTFVNTRHRDWNVNVLFLLKRYGAITIDDVEYSNDNYMITISILDFRLFYENEESYSFLDSIRNKESINRDKNSKTMKTLLIENTEECIAYKFMGIYNLIRYRCCAGCDNHMESIQENVNQFPLVSKNGYLKKIENNYINIVVKTNNIKNVLKKISNLGCHLFVFDKPESVIEIDNNDSTTMLLTRIEFEKVIKNNLFYLDSIITVVLQNNENVIVKYLNYIYELNLKFGISFYIIVNDNYYCEQFDKRLSELLNNCDYEEDYIFMEE